MQRQSFRNILSANKLFFILFAVFFFLGIIIFLNIEKGDAVLYFYHRRSDIGDAFFTRMTRLGEPKFFVGIILLLTLYSFRSALAMLVTGVFTLVIAFGLKGYFDYTRPWVYFKKLGVVGRLEYFKGITPNEYYSFPSGHTYAAFAVFTMLALVLRNKKWTAWLFFVAAMGVGISRIYLFEHFLRDVLAGSILGVITSLLVYYVFYRRFNPDFDSAQSSVRGSTGLDGSLFGLVRK